MAAATIPQNDGFNTLFVTIDQMRADCLFGRLASFAPLPNLQRLAGEAVAFRQHYSVTAPCGPSRASLLTGRYAMNHGSTRNGTPLCASIPNLATEARKAGYLPLLFGYTDTAQDPTRFPPGDPALRTYEWPMTGFDEVLEMRLEQSLPWRAHLAKLGIREATRPNQDLYKQQGSSLRDPPVYDALNSDTAFLANETIRRLTVQPQGWFAHVTFIRPHPPFVAPEPYNRMFDADALPPPVRAETREAQCALHPLIEPTLDAQGPRDTVIGFPDLEPTDAVIADLRAVYLGLLAEVDDNLGCLFTFLKDAGLWDKTRIVVTSDHGELLGDHYAWGKASIHDAAFQVPLLIRDPRFPKRFGADVHHFTESVDITPTLLDLMGLPPLDGVDGYSLRPFLEGNASDNDAPPGWRTDACSEIDFSGAPDASRVQRRLNLSSRDACAAVLRNQSHKLVHFSGDLPQVFFRRGADWNEGESRNVADDPAERNARDAMTRALLSRRMRYAGGRFREMAVTSHGVV